jgi:hypothetical protein
VVSTGVGGGFILGGLVYGGPTGNAGNIGHAIADPDGEPCPCGGIGCVETKECRHYGRNAFARRLKVRLASFSGPEAGLIGAAVLAATSGINSVSAELM